MEIKGIDPLQLLESLQEGIVVHSATTEILYANPRALQILRLSEDQAQGKNAFDPEWRFIDKHHNLMPVEDFPVNRVLTTGLAISNIEAGICDSSSDQITWVLCNAFPQFSAAGDIESVVVGFLDISSRKLAIPFETIVAKASDIIVITGATNVIDDGPRIVYVNQAFCELTGYTSAEVIGKTPRILQGKDTCIETTKRIRQALLNQQPIREVILNYSKTGDRYWLDMNIFPLKNELEEVMYFAAVERDITSQVEREAKLKDMATKDSLTGLLNRRGFYELADRLISGQYERQAATIAIVDIDFFKKVNDSYGHESGDKALVSIAKILRLMFRESDLICRFGGEEFVIFLPKMNRDMSKFKLDAFRKKIANTPIDIGDDTFISLTVSIGVAELNINSTSVDDVVNKADEALYEAKNTGRNKTIVY